MIKNTKEIVIEQNNQPIRVNIPSELSNFTSEPSQNTSFFQNLKIAKSIHGSKRSSLEMHPI